MRGPDMGQLRTWADVEGRIDIWSRYAVWDEVLYELCRRYPRHHDVAGVAAKVFLIGRSYATGIERRAKSPQGGKGMDAVVDVLVSEAADLDASIERLRILSKRRAAVPDIDVLEPITRTHQQLTKLLRRITRGQSPRSFAAKYLHFHAPIVPIYDAIAQSTITRRELWQHWTARPSAGRLTSAPNGVDDRYWGFCQRLLRLADAWRQHGVATAPTARNLDIYLLAGKWDS